MKKYGTHATTAPEGMFCPVSFDLLRLDEWTPDGRRIESAGFSSRELPLSIMVMFRTSAGGHDGAENVGTIDEVTVNDDGTVTGEGWLLNEQIGFAAARRIRSGALRGNSVDIVADDYTIEVNDDGDVRFSVVTSKFGGTTICPVPAFEGCYASVPDDIDIPAASEAIEVGLANAEMLVGAFADLGHIGSFKTRPAAQTKVTKELPPASAFANPQLTVPTPVIVGSDMRAFGHLATWDSVHLATGVRPPRSQTDYAYCRTGLVETNEGMVATGRMVIGGEHAPGDAFWTEAIDFYAATSRCWLDYACGEDDIGIWFSGLVRPGTSDNDVYAARASAVSGDWRPVGAGHELILGLSVNGPGFPQPRAFMREGVQLSLIGANSLQPSVPTRVGSFAASEAVERNLEYVANKFAAEEARAIVAEMDAED